jgi:DnaJ-class molecular chaperone
VANEAGDSQDDADRSQGPRECMACRGSGQVISNLGGTSTTVACPWCAGAGVRLAEVDAQARWKNEQPQSADLAEAPAAPE